MKNILFICGSLNQTTMMHKISMHYPGYTCRFTPYYADGFLNLLARIGILDFSILGGEFRKRTTAYLNKYNLNIDDHGKKNDYDMVFTCSDLIMPGNIRGKKIVLVQEGMTDPENFLYYLVKWFKLPRWIASTSTTGLSGLYTIFCVASKAYKNLFIKKGVPADKIKVTGIPNFDCCNEYLKNNFPHKGYVLAATSDMRETFKYENRKKFIKRVVNIAAGKQIIFKLHPNEKHKRAAEEIKKYSPGTLVYTSGNTEEMIANCDILVTRYSSVVYVALALGKQVYSDFNIDDLKELMPWQNGAESASNIAAEGRKLLHTNTASLKLKAIKFNPQFSRAEK